MAPIYKTLTKGSKSAAAAPVEGSKSANRQRVLIISSRGTTHRHRHLLEDLTSVLPHGRREAKFDSKKRLYELNELAQLYNCNNVLFFEARKGQDLYMYVARVPNGPCLKFHVQNLHTMAELQFTGNCLKGSRPILSFDAAFDGEPYLRLIRELFIQVFGVPPSARRSKPFVDHVMGFTFADGRIWVRHYQVSEEDAAAAAAGAKKETDLSLVEIGPRFCLTPIIIQDGSFGGKITYENKQFVSPNQVRSELRKTKAVRHNARAEQGVERSAKLDELGLRTSSRKASAAKSGVRDLFA